MEWKILFLRIIFDIEEYNRNVVLLPQIVGENVFSKLV